MQTTKHSQYYLRLKPILKNKNVTTYSHVAFSLLAIMIFSLFAIRPTVKDVLTLQNTIEQQSKVLKDLQTKSTNIKYGIINYNNIDLATKLKLYTFLPNSTSLPCLINSLNTIAQVSQVSISGLQIQPTGIIGETKCELVAEDLDILRQKINNNTLQEVKFTFNVQGSYDKLINVLDQLRATNRLINIESVNFLKPEEGDIILSVTAKGYFYK